MRPSFGLMFHPRRTDEGRTFLASSSNEAAKTGVAVTDTEPVICTVALQEDGGVQVSGNVIAHEKERKDAVRQGCRCCAVATGAG